jgi:hypothetical protein
VRSSDNGQSSEGKDALREKVRHIWRDVGKVCLCLDIGSESDQDPGDIFQISCANQGSLKKENQ